MLPPGFIIKFFRHANSLKAREGLAFTGRGVIHGKQTEMLPKWTIVFRP